MYDAAKYDAIHNSHLDLEGVQELYRVSKCLVRRCSLTPGSPQVHPRFTPGYPQVHPRFTPGSPQVHPRFTPLGFSA